MILFLFYYYYVEKSKGHSESVFKDLEISV